MANIAAEAVAPDEILSTIRAAIDDGLDQIKVEALLDGLPLDRDHRDALALYAWAYAARGGSAVRLEPVPAA